MDFSALKNLAIYSETKFRTPLRTEKQIGIWVDRIGETSLKKTQDIPKLRKLGQYAVVLIEAGKGFFISPTTGHVKLNESDVIILFPDEPTAYYPTESWREKYIVWNGPDAYRFEKLGFLTRQKMIITDNIGVISAAFERLKEIITDEEKAAILERKNIITNVVLEIFKLSNPIDRKDKWSTEISAAILWLTENYAKEISISDLAEKYNLSESHFRRHFKRHTGRSPREFITSLRISRAKELLKQGLTIKKVSSSVGYNDVFYFMRTFKKVTGTSCSRFRAD